MIGWSTQFGSHTRDVDERGEIFPPRMGVSIINIKKTKPKAKESRAMSGDKNAKRFAHTRSKKEGLVLVLAFWFLGVFASPFCHSVQKCHDSDHLHTKLRWYPPNRRSRAGAKLCSSFFLLPRWFFVVFSLSFPKNVDSRELRHFAISPSTKTQHPVCACGDALRSARNKRSEQMAGTTS